ncbi:hypothetical protein DKG74_21255, partial [Zavarzinia aquatilis]
VDRKALTVTAANATKTYDGVAFNGGNGVTYAGFVAGEGVGDLDGALSYGGTAQGAVNAGSYAITAGGLTSGNYAISYVGGTLSIDRKALTITASDATKTYDGQSFTGGAGVTYAGFVAGEDAADLGGTLSYGGTAQGAVNAGNYTITAGGLTSGNYAISYVGGTLSIDRKALTVTASDATKTYDGQAFTGGAGVTYAGFVAGEGVGDLGGTLSYGGTAQGAVNAGSYTITAGGLNSGNYAISYVDGTLIVDRKALTVTAANATKTYDGVAFNGGDGVTYAGFVAGEGVGDLGGALSYGGTAQGAVNAGSYTITAGGLNSGNYAISYVDGTLIVDRKALTVTAANATKTYDGVAFNGGNGVTYAGFVAGEGVGDLDGALSYGGTAQGAVNAGSYAITAGGLSSGNYAISYVGGTLSIDRKALTITASNATKTYDGVAFTGGAGVTYAGFVAGEDAGDLGGTLSYGGTAQGAVNAGSYTITAGGLTSGNYAISYVSGTLSIDRKALTITASNATKTYDGVAFNGGNGVTYAGFVAGEGVGDLGGALSYGGTAQGAVNAGNYTITAGGLTSGNYAISYVGGTLNVDRKALTITASNATKTYDGVAFTGGNGVTYAGFVAGEDAGDFGGALSYGGTAQGAVNAGSYTITAGGLSSGNYAISYVGGTLNVDRKALTVTASDATKTYDGVAFTGGAGVTYTGFAAGEDAGDLGGTLSYGGTAQGAVNAGSYTITAGGLNSSNYAISYVAGSLTVNQAALTVTAANATKTYDGQSFTGGAGVTYAGFVAGEDAGDLGGTLSYGGTAQGAVNAGSYTITAGGLSSGNYAISYVGGTLNVDRKALTVTAANATKTYDGVAFTGGAGVTYAGFVAGEDAGDLGGTLSYGGTAQGAVNAGSYTITAGGLSSGNYAISYVAGSLTVDQAALTVTAANATKTYDGQSFTGGAGVTYAGFVAGEDAGDVGGTLSYGGTAQGAVNAGSYTITAGGLSSGNYAISYVGGTLNVDRKALTITASNATKTYDGVAFTGGNGVTYAGFVAGEDAGDVGGALSYGGTAQGAVNAGSYTITAGGLSSGNYAISYVAGSLTVDQAALTVTAANATKTYDGVAFNGGAGVTYAGFVAGEDAGDLGGTLSYGGTAQGAVNAGSYTITAGGLSSGNYAISYVAGNLTVNQAALTVTAANATKTYDGVAFNGGNGVTYAGFVAGEDAGDLGGTLSYGGTAQGAVNAGSYTITAGGLSSGNYAISYVGGTLNVDRKALTVTAANATKTYDGVAFNGGNGVTYAGFVAGEGVGDLGGTLSYGGTAQGAVNAGSYTITAGGLTSGNYAISYVSGTLSIDRKALTITASNATKTYDGQAFTGGNGVTYAGFVAGEGVGDLGGALSYGGTAQGAVNAGNYTITAG